MVAVEWRPSAWRTRQFDPISLGPVELPPMKNYVSLFVLIRRYAPEIGFTLMLAGLSMSGAAVSVLFVFVLAVIAWFMRKSFRASGDDVSFLIGLAGFLIPLIATIVYSIPRAFEGGRVDDARDLVLGSSSAYGSWGRGTFVVGYLVLGAAYIDRWISQRSRPSGPAAGPNR